MKRLLRRTLSVCLALVLAFSLAAPSMAATVKVTGVKLSETELVLIPGESASLTATVTPYNASNEKVTWESNREDIVYVSSNGTVTAQKVGTADVTAVTKDGGYRAVCRVTVEEEYVTEVKITPADPGTMYVDGTRQLSAKVYYAHQGENGNQSVTWSSSNPNVAEVSSKGKVTAVSEGTVNIMAMSKEKGRDGVSVFQVVSVKVDPKSGDPANDVLKLSQPKVSETVGQYQTLVLDAPAAVMNGGKDVSANYTMLYTWKDANGNNLSNQSTYSLTPVEQGVVKLSCTVTAVSKEDSTRLLASIAEYTVQIQPGTVLGGTVDVSAGATTLDKLMELGGQLSIMDQLIKGRGDQLTPAIAGLKSVVFYPEKATGTAGKLGVEAGKAYVTDDQTEGDKISKIVFTPAAVGTYIIPFHAYGNETWYGQLEIQVTGQGQTVAPQPTDPQEPAQQPAAPADHDAVTGMSCDSAGITFMGSDFFHEGDADPVVSLVLGKTDSGQLIRNMTAGSGTQDAGARYYTNSAQNGDYHISTLTFLPKAGFAGEASIPVIYTLQSGKIREDTLKIQVTHKTVSTRFADVTPENTGNWSADAVDFAFANGLVNGVDDRNFAPGATMTRAMLVTILYRAAGSPEMAVTSRFTDLQTNGYYYNAVVWATAMGIVNGTSDRTFEPDTPVNRQMLATILYRYADQSGRIGEVASGSLRRFSDRNQVQKYAETGMTWAINQGILKGTTETTLSPNDPASRAQVVVMLHRYLAG